MGSTMIRTFVRAGTVAIGGVYLIAAVACAGGLYVGSSFFALNVADAYARVPLATAAVIDALDATMANLGFSPQEIADIHSVLVEAGNRIEETVDDLPSLVPLPLLGVAIEIPLPLVVVDGLRITGGLLTDGILRSAATVAGFDVPKPLFETEFDIHELAIEGAASVDVDLSAWMLSTEVVKRIDLFLLGFTLGAGLDLIQGRVEPVVDLDASPEIDDGLRNALAALHLDELTWSTFGVHATVGIELGLPFLRIYGDLRFLLPLSERDGWWGLRAGDFSGLVGIAILF